VQGLKPLSSLFACFGMAKSHALIQTESKEKQSLEINVLPTGISDNYKAGPEPRLVHCPANSAVLLPPVPFYQDPAAVALFPAMSNPNRAGMRWMRPVALHPNIAPAVPAVIAVDPHPSGMRWTIVDFDDRRRRSDANHYSNLGQCGCRRQTHSQNQ